MENDGDGEEAPRDHENPETDDGGDSAAAVVQSGPMAGNRSGGMAFLALMVALAAAVHFYLTGTGPESFPARLDTDLLTHAELTLAAMEDGNNMAIVPSWPQRLYAILRRDIALYTAFLAVAAFFWGLSARARARRDAFLVHEKLSAEIAELRGRLDSLNDSSHQVNFDKKG